MNVFDFFLYFKIYSFLGYLCEVVYVSVLTKKLTNRGFLYGPVCPIYGYGAVLIILCLEPLHDYWYLVAILGCLLTSSLEYLTSFFMEKIFKMRLWDYSSKKFNINGRVCLRNSLMFTALCIILIYAVHPGVVWLIGQISSETIKIVLCSVLFVIDIVDTVFSTIKHFTVSNILNKVQAVMENLTQTLEQKREQLKEYFENSRIAKRLKRTNNIYPTLNLRSAKTKKKTSLHELLEKIRKSKEEE